MLKTIHADILNKPYAQIKDLKLYCPDEIDTIKAQHKSAWQVFKAFNLAVYKTLPAYFAKPHIESWCNGWEIRRHFFAYYKYDCYLGNAPIMMVVLNKQRLIVALSWHAYKADISNTTLDTFNNWITDILWQQFDDFYVWHSRINNYGNFLKVCDFDSHNISLNVGEYYRLGKFIDKDKLDNYTNAALITWVSDTLQQLSQVYEYCH